MHFQSELSNCRPIERILRFFAGQHFRCISSFNLGADPSHVRRSTLHLHCTCPFIQNTQTLQPGSNSSFTSPQVTYNVSDFQLRNAEHVLSRDVCNALFHSHLVPLPELFPEANPARTPIRRPASRCAQLSAGFIRMLDTLCSTRQMHFAHCIRPNRLLPTRQLTLLPTSQSTVILTSNASVSAAISSSTQTNKSPKFTKYHLQQCKLSQVPASTVTCNCPDHDQYCALGAPVASINHRPITPMASSSSSGSSIPVKKPIVVTIALDSQYVLEQIRALQLAPYACLQSAGFAHSIEYARFYRRFALLIIDYTSRSNASDLFADLPPMADELQLLRTARALASKQSATCGQFILDPSVLDRFCPFSCNHSRSQLATSTTGRLCPWFLHQSQTSRSLIANQANDHLVRCAHLLTQLQVPTEQVQLGHSRIFFRHLQTWFRLERLRTLRLDHLVRRIQRMWRFSLARRNFLVIRRSQRVIARSYLLWKVWFFHHPFCRYLFHWLCLVCPTAKKFLDALSRKFAVRFANMSRLAGCATIASAGQLFDSKTVPQVESECPINSKNQQLSLHPFPTRILLFGPVCQVPSSIWSDCAPHDARKVYGQFVASRSQD